MHFELTDKENDRGFIWIILLAILAFLPFIVYAKVVIFDELTKGLYNKTGNVNFFSWYRVTWLYILTGFGWLGFVISPKCKNEWLYKPLFVLSFFSVLSAAISKYPEISLWGNPERHEGLLAFLCYLSILVFFSHLVNESKKQEFFVFSVLISGLLIGLIGSFQFFGFDYFHSTFCDRCLIPDSVLDLAPGWDFADKPRELNSIFSVFGNSNFTGSYIAMLFPLSWLMVFKSSGKKRIFLFILNAILFVNLVGAKSRASLLAVLIAVVISLIFFRLDLKKNLKLFIALFVSYCLLFFAMEAYSIKGQFRLLDTFFVRESAQSVYGGSAFENIEINGREASLVFGGSQVKFWLDDSRRILFSNSSSIDKPLDMRFLKVSEDGQPLSDSILKTPSPDEPGDILLAPNNNEIKIKEKALEDGKKQRRNLLEDVISINDLEIYRLIFRPGALPGYEVYFLPQVNVLKIGRGGPFALIKVNMDGISMLNTKLEEVSTEEPPSIGFKGREAFGSGRGYIWSRTLPLLKKAFFTGYGPDTFVAHFPNNDVVGKLKYWGTLRMIFEKPHSLYLQIAMNSGIVSLIAFLTLVFMYLKESFMIYSFIKIEEFSFYSGAGICIAVIGYLVAGIFVDSVVAVAPVFWGLLGLGIATNRMNRLQMLDVECDSQTNE